MSISLVVEGGSSPLRPYLFIVNNIHVENVINLAFNWPPIYFFGTNENHNFLVSNIYSRNTSGTVVIFATVKHMTIQNVTIEDAGVYKENLGGVVQMITGVHYVLKNFTFINCFNPEPEGYEPKSLIMFIIEDFA